MQEKHVIYGSNGLPYGLSGHGLRSLQVDMFGVLSGYHILNPTGFVCLPIQQFKKYSHHRQCEDH